MKIQQGQSLIEFSLVGLLVLALSLAALYFFGDALVDLFEQNNANTLFQNETRTALDPGP